MPKTKNPKPQSNKQDLRTEPEGLESSPTRTSRRNVLRSLGAAALLTPAAIQLLAACSKDEDSGTIKNGDTRPVKSPELTSAYIPILDSVPLIVAYAKGFFEEAGIQASKPSLIRGWPALTEAFTSKQVLLTHILLPQVLFLRYARNVPVRSVAFNHTNVVAMLLAEDVPSIRDLGGRIVGCPTWWAPHTGIFQDVVRAAGLVPVVGKQENELRDNEVAFRVVPPPDMVDGLKSKRIAGCTVSEPFGAGAEVLANATLVKMSGDVWPNHPCCQSVMLQETIDRDPKWSEAVTNALYRAALWASQNREELAELLGKDGGGYFPMPVKVVSRALLNQDLETYGPDGTGAIMHTDWHVNRVNFSPYPYPSAFETTIDLMRRMVVDQSAALPLSISQLTGRQIANDVVDYDLARKGIEAAGGLQAFGATDFERTEQYEVLLK